jgi:hypothetical protein
MQIRRVNTFNAPMNSDLFRQVRPAAYEELCAENNSQLFDWHSGGGQARFPSPKSLNSAGFSILLKLKMA